MVRIGVKVGCHRVDQRGCHRQFLRTYLDVLVKEREVSGTDLIGPEQGLQHQDAITASQGGEGFPLAQCDLGDRDPARLLKRIPQQRVRPGTGRLRLDVVASVEQDRVKLLRRREVQHLDRLGRRKRQIGQILFNRSYYVEPEAPG